MMLLHRDSRVLYGSQPDGPIRTMRNEGPPGRLLWHKLSQYNYFINANIAIILFAGNAHRENTRLTRQSRSACNLQQGYSRSKHAGIPAPGSASTAIIHEGHGLPFLSGMAVRPSYAAFISDVQWPQRVALRGMVERQKGHSLVVGAAGAAASWR